MVEGRTLTGKPEALIRKALELDPQLPKALALAGTLEIEKGNKAGARSYYERMLAALPPDSEQASEVRSILVELGGAPTAAGPLQPHPAVPSAGGPVASAASAAPAAKTAPGADMGVSGTVTLAAALARNANPDDTVFVFARAPQGPRMPLAIQRHKVSELPLTFRLDDSNGMAGGPTISTASAVKIEARISKGGDAIPKPGDLHGESAIVAPGATGVSIVIDQVVK
jgi:cytochrome c-type biogenesis protein CcmH